MTLDKPIELFDPDNYGSIMREIVRMCGKVNLQDFRIPAYQIPENYKTKDIKIKDSDKYAKTIRDNIEGIIEDIEIDGYQHNIYTALYEAVLNAYQHGNKKDPNKIITVAYNMNEEGLNISVSDEGGLINPEFISYITKFRKKDYKFTGESFYDFTKQDLNGVNLGVGTNFIHQYVDKVNYYKNSNGGLTIEMIKNKKLSKKD